MLKANKEMQSVVNGHEPGVADSICVQEDVEIPSRAVAKKNGKLSRAK